MKDTTARINILLSNIPVAVADFCSSMAAQQGVSKTAYIKKVLYDQMASCAVKKEIQKKEDEE